MVRLLAAAATQPNMDSTMPATPYRFVHMKQAALPKVKPAKTIPRTKKHYHLRSTGRAGRLEWRRYPCWCKLCLHATSESCRNVAFCGEWEMVAVNLQ